MFIVNLGKVFRFVCLVFIFLYSGGVYAEKNNSIENGVDRPKAPRSINDESNNRYSKLLPAKDLKKVKYFTYFDNPLAKTLFYASNEFLAMNYKDSLYFLDRFISSNKKRSKNYTKAVRMRLHVKEKLSQGSGHDALPKFSEGLKRDEAISVYNQLIRKEVKEKNELNLDNRIKEIKKAEINYRSFLPEMIRVPSGEIQVNCAKNKTCDSVKVKSFRMSKYEITERLWTFIMDDNTLLANENITIDFPQTYVSRDTVLLFISRLNKLTGRKYRLPSDLEWEFAARPNRKDLRYLGNIKKKDTYSKVNEVGQSRANKYGLFDMYGNVSELVNDCYHEGKRQRFISVSNDTAVCHSGRYVYRGGNFSRGATWSTTRGGGASHLNGGELVGFRLAL